MKLRESNRAFLLWLLLMLALSACQHLRPTGDAGELKGTDYIEIGLEEDWKF